MKRKMRTEAKRKRAPGGGRKPGLIRSRSLNLWLPEDLHASLMAGAKRNHRSLNAEVRVRLADSFIDYGVPQATQRFAARIARLVYMIEGNVGASWQDDRATFNHVRQGIDELLSHLAPTTDATARAPDPVARRKVGSQIFAGSADIGRDIARALLVSEQVHTPVILRSNGDSK